MTTPTPAELRELAKVMHGSRMPDSGQCDAAGHALWACADLIERMPDVEKLRRLVERMDAHSRDPDCTDGWQVASNYWRKKLAALLPDNEEPK